MYIYMYMYVDMKGNTYTFRQGEDKVCNDSTVYC